MTIKIINLLFSFSSLFACCCYSLCHSIMTGDAFCCCYSLCHSIMTGDAFCCYYSLCHSIMTGRVWAGHDISRFDCMRLREAFAEIKRPPPEPKRIIDTLVSLTQKFGRRAGNMKLKSLAAYFGLGQQSHRSLGDVRMNFEVVKFCAAVLFLEPSQLDTSTENNGASLNAVNGYRSNGNTSLEGSSLNTSPFPSNRNIEKVGLSVDKMKRDPVQSNEANMISGINEPEIVFFDLETTIPVKKGQPYAILEFGSILLCPKKLTELESYETLVKPLNMSLISTTSISKNNITQYDVLSMPTFAEIADRVYNILHGRVWAGHDISRFDCERLREAYAQINRPPPEPKRIIDTLVLLTQKFGRRAGNMKMASLAAYFGLGRQSHRSLGDARMNLEVVKCCATVLFLESSQQDSFTGSNGASLNAGNGYCYNGNATLAESASYTSPLPSNRDIETDKFPTNHTAQDKKMGSSVDKLEADHVQSNEAIVKESSTTTLSDAFIEDNEFTEPVSKKACIRGA